MNKKRAISLIAVLGIAALLFAGCQSSKSSKYLNQQGTLSSNIAGKLTTAVPYPLAQMNYSTERANLRERLLRFNNPAKIGYVYILSSLSGKPVGYYTIKGKVSSTDSQLTVTQQMDELCTSNHCYGAPINSMGDDGSFGGNEGGQNGVFFFTTSGVMIETVMPWIYSDAPLPLTVPSLNPTSAPSSTSSYFHH